MQFNDADKRKWHRWFAWHPLTLICPDTDAEITFWLEPVWRKRINGYWFPYWVYNGGSNHPDDVLAREKANG